MPTPVHAISQVELTPVHVERSTHEPKKTDARAVVDSLTFVLETLRDPEAEQPMGHVAAQAALNLCTQISNHLSSILNTPRGFARVQRGVDDLKAVRAKGDRLSMVASAMQQQRLSTIVRDEPSGLTKAQTEGLAVS